MGLKRLPQCGVAIKYTNSPKLGGYPYCKIIEVYVVYVCPKVCPIQVHHKVSGYQLICCTFNDMPRLKLIFSSSFYCCWVQVSLTTSAYIRIGRIKVKYIFI